MLGVIMVTLLNSFYKMTWNMLYIIINKYVF